MRQIEVEHHFKNRFVGRHFFNENDPMTTFGSSRDAGIRLLGEDVSGMHAVLQFSENQWTVSDLGSEKGTWIKKKPIVNYEMNGPTVVTIGGHSLRFIPKILEHDLFVSDSSKEPDLGFEEDRFEIFHQIVVFKNGFVIESKLLKENRSWKVKVGKEIHKFVPPKSFQWEKKVIGDISIKHRLIKSKSIEGGSGRKLKALWDPNFRVPIIAAFVFMVIFTALVVFAPKDFNQELTELKPEKTTMTRIALDKKFRKKKMDRATALKDKIIKKTPHPQGPSSVAQSTAPARAKSPEKARVISKLKSANLQSLLGRISKRASKTAKFVERNGVSAERSNLGRSVSSIASTEKLLDNVEAITPNFKISNVGTSGKASGNKSYKNYGGLESGSVGQAQVGIIEEETEIEGGLEKDAIAQVIKSQIGEIRYCYERQLSAHPDLYGKVIVKFTIGASGQVKAQSVGRSTLNSSMVEGCILRRVAQWKFPNPKGGTSVLVTYPFLFKSTN